MGIKTNGDKGRRMKRKGSLTNLGLLRLRGKQDRIRWKWRDGPG